MPRKTNTTINNNDYYRVTATIGKAADGKPIRKQFYGSNKKEAEAKRDEYIANIKQGLAINYDKALFSVAFKAWLDNVLRPSVALSSYRRYEVDYRLRIRDCGLASMRLTDIRAANIQALYSELLVDYTPNTIWNTDKLLRHFFNYAVKSDLIIKSPMLAVELPADKSVKPEKHILGRDEAQRLIDEARENPDAVIFAFAVLSGLRQGEILALKHSDIDFKAGKIHVNKTVDFLTIDGSFKPLVTVPKTQASIRTVPIMDALKPLLSTHIRREKEKHFKECTPWTLDSILFSSAKCTYIEGGNIRKRLKRLLKKLGIEPTSFHALRHSFCTLLAEQGVPLKTASMLMGHSSISITAKYYTHVDDAEKRRGIEKLSNAFI